MESITVGPNASFEGDGGTLRIDCNDKNVLFTNITKVSLHISQNNDAQSEAYVEVRYGKDCLCRIDIVPYDYEEVTMYYEIACVAMECAAREAAKRSEP